MEPSRTLAFSKLSGHKKEKSRVSILCAVNASGTEKMKLAFIHTSRRPHALRNINYDNLPVHYYSNKKAWMQMSIFNELLLKLNSRMNQRSRKIILLVDRAPVHIVLDKTKAKLNCIQVEFLLANTTPVLQLCDAGVIYSFKCHYKSLFIQNRIKGRVT